MARTRYSDKDKAAIIKALKDDYSSKNRKKIAGEKKVGLQTLNSWCKKAGHTGDDKEKKSTPIRITSQMRAQFAEEMEAHSAKEKAIDAIELKIQKKQEEIDKLQADYDTKDAELIKLQTKTEKKLGMI